MIRLQRRGVKAPADWQTVVDAAFPDAKAFWKRVRSFEKLAEHGGKRKKGFSTYAPGVLPLDAKGAPDFPPVWRTDVRVRQAIAGMSKGLCAYCQSAVTSTHPGKGGKTKPPGQIEHFQPKSRFPSRAYDWGNYFLGCMGCNGAKHDKWVAGGYVRPDRGKPGDRFVFGEDGEISWRAGDAQARNTVRDFGLKREWLTQHRGTAIKSHIDFVRRMMRRRGVRLKDFFIRPDAVFSEAINQNVRRVWAERRRKKHP